MNTHICLYIYTMLFFAVCTILSRQCHFFMSRWQIRFLNLEYNDKGRWGLFLPDGWGRTRLWTIKGTTDNDTQMTKSGGDTKGRKQKQGVKHRKSQADEIIKIKQDGQKQQIVIKSGFIKLYIFFVFLFAVYVLLNRPNATCYLRYGLFASRF